MGYLDNSSITVDAVLTKKGREILKDGGNLNVTQFTLSDTGVDYTLWNPSHPSGSAYYGEAIENMPMLEASVHAENNLRNRLISLDQNTVAVPALVLGNLDTAGGNTLTLDDADIAPGRDIHVELVGMSGTEAPVSGYQYYFTIHNPSIVSTGAELVKNISGTGNHHFLDTQKIPFAQTYGFSGKSFNIKPILLNTAGKQTQIHVTHVKTGAYGECTVINNATKMPRKVLSTVRSGN